MEVNKSHHLSWASWRLRKASSTIPVWAWQLESQGANSASHRPGMGKDPVLCLGLQSEGMRGKSILPCFFAFLLPCFFPPSLPFFPSFCPSLPLSILLSFLSSTHFLSPSIFLFFLFFPSLSLPPFFPSCPLWLVKSTHIRQGILLYWFHCFES